jgi:DNA-binding MarR family transcriptional regulator/GNAT superfamily N-acetyltransferase
MFEINSKVDLLEKTDSFRRFNRFYTGLIGVLDEHLLESPFSLTQARVIYELAHRGEATASEIATSLSLDAGYLSRMVADFQKRELIKRAPAKTDARAVILTLTPKGQKAFEGLDRRSRRQSEAILERLPTSEQDRLLAAMRTIEDLLSPIPPENRQVPYILRPPRPGDLGWVVQANGELYAREYAWNVEYEVLVAKIVADFAENFDPKREQCWIAEMDGKPVGSVFLVKKSATVAKLRLLIVDPKARGLGIGKRLVDECTNFARLAGYKKITLWTNRVLLAARSIYQKAGYKLTKSEKHHSFGHDLIGETWELKL